MTRVRLVFTLFSCAAVLTARQGEERQDTNPRELMRRAVEIESKTSYLPRDYIYRYKEVQREFDSAGHATKTTSKTYEVSILYGKQFTRLLERDGQPLPASDAAKVRDRFDAAVAKRARLSEEEREREDAREREKLARDDEGLLQIPDLFNFTSLGEQTLNGRQAYVVAARARTDAHPKGATAADMTKLSGKFWIDQTELRWVRIEAKAESTVRFGFFLGSLSPGSTLLFEQARINDEVWLPKVVRARFLARLLVKHFNLEVETTFYDYRRFRSDTRLITAPPK